MRKVLVFLWSIVGFFTGMNIFLVFLVCCFFGCKTTGSYYTQQSNIDPRKTIIYSRKGNEKGWLQKSNIDPRNTVQYSKKGNAKGYWQRSAIDPRKTVFHKRK